MPGIHGLQELHLVAFQQSQRHAVTVENTISCEGRKFWSWREDASKVERIGTRQRDQGLLADLSPHFAQFGDCLWQRKLFSGKPSHEPPAADFAARFEPTVDAK